MCYYTIYPHASFIEEAPKATCPFILYGQLVPTSVPLHLMQELEAESDDKRFEDARASGDASRVAAEVAKLHSMVNPASTAVYNCALEALVRVRTSGEPLDKILALYHEMIDRSVVPNFRTYIYLITAHPRFHRWGLLEATEKKTYDGDPGATRTSCQDP